MKTATTYILLVLILNANLYAENSSNIPLDISNNRAGHSVESLLKSKQIAQK